MQHHGHYKPACSRRHRHTMLEQLLRLTHGAMRVNSLLHVRSLLGSRSRGSHRLVKCRGAHAYGGVATAATRALRILAQNPPRPPRGVRGAFGRTSSSDTSHASPTERYSGGWRVVGCCVACIRVCCACCTRSTRAFKRYGAHWRPPIN